MTDLTLRLDKGTPLTNQEVDDNFAGLNADKYEAGDSPVFANIDADTIQLSGGTGNQGVMSWNADEETLDLIQNGATLQLGQETQVHCRNQSGSTIPDGTAVYAMGTIGNSGRITVAPMIADGSIAAKYILGVTTEEIPNNEDGKVTSFGKVRDLDTTAFTDGDVLYVSPNTAGLLTSTEPTAPDISLPIATVIHAHSNGTLFVRVTPTDENAHLKTSGGLLTGSIDETVYALTGTDLDPDNGTIQTIVLSSSVTLTESLTNGQSLTFMIDDGAAYAITWPAISWVTDAGVAPALNTDSFTTIQLWKVGGILYGARVGDA